MSYHMDCSTLSARLCLGFRDAKACLCFSLGRVFRFALLCVFFGLAGNLAIADYIVESGGRLTFPADESGYRIPDFSYAGYRYGNEDLPEHGIHYDTKVTVSLSASPSSDNAKANHAALQAAIDSVEALPLNQFGYRGAVEIPAGTWWIQDKDDALRIEASGVVIRGRGKDVTILQEYLDDNSPSMEIRFGALGVGEASNNWELFNAGRDGTHWDIVTPVVAVGDMAFEIESGHSLQVGDEIIIEHMPTESWVNAVDGGGVTNDPVWPVSGAGSVPIRYWRTVAAVAGGSISIDAPVMYSLVRSISQCTVYRYTERFIENVGIEDLTVDVDQYYGDEAAPVYSSLYTAINYLNVKNGWARNVKTMNFRRNGFKVDLSRNITLDSCDAVEPHAVITSAERYNFSSEGGQLVLYKDCYANRGRHNFVTNGWAMDSGNVYLRCTAEDNYAACEHGHQRWANGSLWDGCVFRLVSTAEAGSRFSLQAFWLGNHGDNSVSHGWASVTGVAYRCVVDPPLHAIIAKPPTGMNYEIECIGNFSSDHFAHGDYPGAIDVPTQGVLPVSLYEAQLSQRLGRSEALALAADQAQVDFGFQVIGEYSDVELTLSNVSGSGLDIGSANIAVDNAVFSVLSGGVISDLSNGENHVATLRYRPIAAGWHAGTLDVTGDVALRIPVLGIACSLQSLPRFEAESGTLMEPFAVVDGYLLSSVRDEGVAVYALDIDQAGTYRLDAMVNASTSGSNSVYFAFDRFPLGAADTWDVQPLTDGFEMRAVTRRGSSGTFENPEFNPASFELDKGIHYLIVQAREVGMQLDAIYIIPDSSSTPPPPADPSDLIIEGDGTTLF